MDINIPISPKCYPKNSWPILGYNLTQALLPFLRCDWCNFCHQQLPLLSFMVNLGPDPESLLSLLNGGCDIIVLQMIRLDVDTFHVKPQVEWLTVPLRVIWEFQWKSLCCYWPSCSHRNSSAIFVERL